MLSAWNQLRGFVETSVAPHIPPSVTAALALPPAPPPPPPVEPFPALPPELVLRILDFTLPPPSYTHAHGRAKKLKQYALLSRDCARWAVLALRTDVGLTSLDAAKWFAMTARKKGPAWAGAVRSLRLGSAEQFEQGRVEQGEAVDRMWRSEGSGEVVQKLLRVCENVEELWVCGNLIELFRADLRRLYLTEARIVPSASSTTDTPALVLPALHSLYLKSVIFTGLALSQLLSPDVLPALRTLDYLSIHQSLVVPLVHPRRPVPGAFLGGAGGPPNLANITASLAALAPPPASVTPGSSASPSAAAELHPLLALSPQLTALSLGPHATRTLPLSLLTSGGLALHFPALVALSLPWNLFTSEQLVAGDFPPNLRGLRVTKDGRRRDADEAARDLTGEEGAMSPTLVQKREKEVEEVVAKGLDVFEHLGRATASSGGWAERCFTVPVLDRKTRPVHARPRSAVEQRLADLTRSADGAEAEEATVEAAEEQGEAKEERVFCQRAVEGAEVDGFHVLIEREDGEYEELHDGVWEVGHERWRERLSLT